MAARGPAYKLEDFVAACSEAASVFVLRSAMATAPADFGLQTEQAVRDFIGAGGLEQPAHANTAPWEKNPDPAAAIPVDSYDFFSGPDPGYLAFMHQPKTGRWLVKSLKKNDKPDPRPRLLADKLRKAGLIG